MTDKISISTITALGVAGVICLLLPAVLIIYYSRKEKISLRAVGWGALAFFVFALVLEGLAHIAVAQTGALHPGGALASPIAYALYGGLMAGLFEETARFIVYKRFIPNKRQWKDGLAYGLGHGGIEMLLLGGLNLIVLFVIGISYNGGSTFPMDVIISIKTGWHNYALGGFERIMALVIQIALSIFLLYGIRNNRNIYLLYAILLHALLDFAPAFYQKGLLNLYAAEAVTFVLAITGLIYLIRSRKLFENDEDPTSHTSQRML